MAHLFKAIADGWAEARSVSQEPLTGEGDAGFGMSLCVEKGPPPPKTISVTVNFAPLEMYETLIEQTCRKSKGSEQPWLVYVFEDGLLIMYHFASATWHKVRFSVAAKKCIRKAWCIGAPRILLEIVPSYKRPYDLTLALWNPVSGAVANLPHFQNIRNPAAFFVGKDKVIAAGTDMRGMYTWIELYTSSGKSWRVIGSLPRPYCIRLEHITEYKGTYYALIIYPDSHMLEIRLGGSQVLSICQTPKVWRPILVVCMGSLYMVGLNFDNDNVRIWKLCDESQRWELIAETVSPVSEVEREVFSVISVGNTFVFCSSGHMMFFYDLLKSTWGFLPVCPKDTRHAIKWFPAATDAFD